MGVWTARSKVWALCIVHGPYQCRVSAEAPLKYGCVDSSILLNEIMDSNHKEASGEGQYSKTQSSKKHIVVLGGAVNNFNKEIVEGFVNQICSCVRASPPPHEMKAGAVKRS